MHLLLYLLVLSCGCLGSAIALSEASQLSSVGKWTVFHFRRVCQPDQTQCKISFLIAKDFTAAPEFCSFTVNSPEGVAASQLDFSNAKCSELDDYSINCGWDERGFIVVVIINEKEGRHSFFGFEDADLEDGHEARPQSSDVFQTRKGLKRRSGMESHQQGRLASK